MQTYNKIQSVTERVLRLWYYNRLSDQHVCCYNPETDQIYFFYTTQNISDEWSVIARNENLYWIDRDELISMDMSVQEALLLGMSHKIAKRIISEAKQIRKNYRCAA